MVKAKDFWNYVCEGLDYRFFSGVICPEFKTLYDKMSPEFMHYIPAANERIALGVVSGASIAGNKSGLLMDMRHSHDITSLLRFNIDYRVPFLIIGYGDNDSNMAYDFPRAYIKGNFKAAVKRVVKEMESESIPGLLILGKGVIE